MAVNYDINYDDELFTAVKDEEKAALEESGKLYDDAIDSITGAYEDSKKGIEDYKNEQTRLQQEQYDITIKEIEQKETQAEKDYLKEQSAAYVDYQKAIDPYGVNAETIAARGLMNTGYSENSKVAMYNQYQVRITTARESFLLARQNFTNMMANARIQNSAALAKIAYDAFVEQTKLATNYAIEKSGLLIEKANAQKAIKNDSFIRWQAVLDQINMENAHEEGQFDIIPTTSPGDSISEESSTRDSSTIRENKETSSGEKTNTSLPSELFNLTPDMQSILDLGYGMISAKQLDKLISQGIVEEYVSDGKLKYRKKLKFK